MRRHTHATFVALALVFTFSTTSVFAQSTSGPPFRVVPPITGGAPLQDETSIVVRFRTNASAANRSSARGRVGSLRRASRMVRGLEHVSLRQGMDVERALRIMRRRPDVEYAHRNYRIRATQQAPSDQYFAEQWALHNTGQASMFGVWPAGTDDADIDWPEARDEAAGNGVVVAVLDTGIDYQHTDIAANVWINEAEANGVAGVDDDGNGYIDDIRGWDFANDDNDPLDGHGHGTHVSGIIAAVTNNGYGTAGLMWTGQVMALKVLDDTGLGYLFDAVDAIEYATAMGVRVSNNSWGYSEVLPFEVGDHNALRDAIEAAQADGLLFVAAAGNDSVDTDVAPHYPSSFDLDNIISVAGTDNNDALAWFSSYGPVSVDLAAPGDYVFSAWMRFAGQLDDWAWSSGTSMATPHVAAVAGLLFGLQPNWTYQQVRDQILNNVRVVSALSGTSATGGILNTHDALDGVPDAATPLTIFIDIDPWSTANEVLPASDNPIAVSILTEPAFNAADVDPASLSFGPGGASLNSGPLSEDTDGDADADMLVGFGTQDSAILCGETSATLTGQTTGGQLFTGTDSVTTSDCVSQGCH